MPDPQIYQVTFLTKSGAFQCLSRLHGSEVLARWLNPDTNGVAQFDCINDVNMPVYVHIRAADMAGFLIGEAVRRNIQQPGLLGITQ